MRAAALLNLNAKASYGAIDMELLDQLPSDGFQDGGTPVEPRKPIKQPQ